MIVQLHSFVLYFDVLAHS